MEYRIEVNERVQDLIDAVNRAIQDGWRPLGGLAIYSGHIIAPGAVSAPRYYQAMTREPA